MAVSARNKVLTDESIMWYGIHRHKKMEDVPAGYLIYCYDTNKCPPNVRVYVQENREVLDKQYQEEQENKEFLK